MFSPHAERNPGCFWSVPSAESLTMEMGETLYVTTRQDLRSWLQQHHADRTLIWLVRYKKTTGRPSLDYAEAVEQAIGFGWIDVFKKSMDEQRYARRFSLRRPKSNWTAGNLERARRMIEAGKMTPAGRGVLPEPHPRVRLSRAGKRKSHSSRSAQ